MPNIKSKKKFPVKARMTKDERKALTGDAVVGLALFIVTGIMPLVVRYAEVKMPPELYHLFGWTNYTDLFAYYKSWFLIAPAAAVFFYFAGDAVTGGIKINFKEIFKKPYVILVSIYIFFVALSNLFSDYKHTALFGTHDRSEGIFAQLAYAVIFLTSVYFVRSARHLKIIMAGLLFSSVVMGSIGAAQYLGHDLFRTELGSVLITGEAGNVASTFPHSYGTLYNPNTYGLYTATLFPLFFAAGFTYRGNKFVNAALLSAAALMAAGILGSRSLGGGIGAVAAVAAIVGTCAINMIKNKSLPPAAVSAACALLIAAPVAVFLFFPQVNASVTNLVEKSQRTLFNQKDPPSPGLVFEDGAVLIKRESELLAALRADDNGDWLLVTDGSGTAAELISAEPNENGSVVRYKYFLPQYGEINITRHEEYFIFRGIYFSFEEGKIFPFRPTGYVIDTSESVRAIGFKGRETWASHRGYIWSRSIPLMLSNVLIGSGSDSFINEFPQNDVAGKLQFMGDPYIIVDKAHNLYIQTAVVTGGISMLALVALIGLYLFTTFASLIKSRGSTDKFYGMKLGVFAAVCAFAVASLATDSTIASTGVFYAILGTGYALNNISE